MEPRWIFWVAFGLVAASLAWELATGVARVRGIGQFARASQPRKYWSWLLLKAFVGAILLVGALLESVGR